MTLTAIEKIGLQWRNHISALWWLGLLYRRPSKFHEALDRLPHKEALKSGLLLYAHSFPYILGLNIIGRILIFGWLGFSTEDHLSNEIVFHTTQTFSGLCLGIIFGIFIGIGFGFNNQVTYGIACGISVAITAGVAGGIAEGISVGIGRGIVGGIMFGVVSGIVLGIIEGAAVGLTRGIAFGVAGGAVCTAIGITVGIKISIAFGIFWGISFIIFVLRLYYYPVHIFLTWINPDLRWYHYHPVVWDDLCTIQFRGLNKLLVQYAEKKPAEGLDEIERLIKDYPSQQTEGWYAKVVLLARVSQQYSDLTQLNELVVELPRGNKGFGGRIALLRNRIGEIIRMQTILNTINRPFFREPTAQSIYSQIDSFRHNLDGIPKDLVSEFRAAADRWLLIAERQLAEAQSITTREATPQVFRAGDPVNRDQEAFVSRNSVVGELEQQIMSSNGCPGLMLFGRRRIGKSSILRNLTGFLPNDVITASVSMQNPKMFTSEDSAVRSITVEVRHRIPDLAVASEASADLIEFYSFLTECDLKLEETGKRLLLTVDEYETIDKKIGEAVFTTHLLDTIRESIQNHRRITWIFAGSHEIDELKNADWTSYLVSARTIEVPNFTLAETQVLLTDPLKHSSLWQNNPDKRPRFDAAFWGEASDGCGIDRVHAEAGGWPHLVQLIAETLVDLINEEEATINTVNHNLMERALDRAIVRGHNVLYELLRRESFLPGEWEYIYGFRRSETQKPPHDERVAVSLRRRSLVTEENGLWQLRVPLMARWLRMRGGTI